MSPATPRRPRTGPLTARQLEVLSLVSHGFSNEDAAEEMGIAAVTFKNYIHTVLVDLGASDRAHAVRIGFEDDLLKPSGQRRPRKPRNKAAAR